jgi:hypothetical protein
MVYFVLVILSGDVNCSHPYTHDETRKGEDERLCSQLHDDNFLVDDDHLR